jgi:hypothetical protein
VASDKITFTHGGKIYALTKDQVVQSLIGVSPEPIRTHWVDVNGTHYPVKQAFAKATKLDRLDFATNQARNHLRRLGFAVGRNDAQAFDWEELVRQRAAPEEKG